MRGHGDEPRRFLGGRQPAAGRLVVLAALACVLGPACEGGPAPSSQAATGRSTSAPAPSTKAVRHRLSTAVHQPKRHRRHTRHRRAAHHRATVPAVEMPNPRLTPGAALPVGTARICQSGYASSVRDVPESEKDEVYARYGVAHVPYRHEVDHLVSLEIGGSNAISNLWPEPYAGRWGARTKDVLEDRLHGLVCAVAIGLRYAQRIEARNWVAAYHRYVGTPPVATSSALGSSGGTGAAGGSGGGTCTPGYSPCIPYRGGEDYDCYGGGGNGPLFTSAGVTYTVTGDDPYDLDGNHDGRACG